MTTPSDKEDDGKCQRCGGFGFVTAHWRGMDGVEKCPSCTSSLSNIDDDRIHHVYPTFGREHVTNKRDQCWCKPKVEFEWPGVVIIHEAEQ